jgi:outer membrane autotransporter protein
VLQEIIANLGNAATNGAANHVLESVQPTVDGSGQTAALDVSDHVLGLTGERLASLRDGSDWGVTGMSAGDAYGNEVERIEPAVGKDNDSASLLGQARPLPPAAAAAPATTQSQTYAAPPPAVDYSRGIPATMMWAEAFGQHSNQGERDSIAGYSASTWGGAAGMDTRNIADNMVAGVAVSYGRTDANSQNANSTDTNVDSYQVTLYGDYSPPGGSYVDGMLAYGWNHDDTTRHDVGGITGLTSHGSYDANQVTAQAEAGREYREGNTILTPDIMAHGVWYNPASYTETGAGGADLHIDGNSQTLFELGAGLKAGWVIRQESGGVIKPQLRAGYRYAVVDDRIEDTAQFTGGGGAFTAQGPDPARSRVNLGASLKYLTTANWDLTASYDFNWKADYTSNAGFVRAGYRF